MKKIFPQLLMFIFFVCAFNSAKSDIYAQLQSGNYGVVLMTNQCPADKTGELKFAIQKNGSNLREGCYLINERGNPVIVWQDGEMQEFNKHRFEYSGNQKQRKEVIGTGVPKELEAVRKKSGWVGVRDGSKTACTKNKGEYQDYLLKVRDDSIWKSEDGNVVVAKIDNNPLYIIYANTERACLAGVIASVLSKESGVWVGTGGQGGGGRCFKADNASLFQYVLELLYQDGYAILSMPENKRVASYNSRNQPDAWNPEFIVHAIGKADCEAELARIVR